MSDVKTTCASQKPIGVTGLWHLGTVHVAGLLNLGFNVLAHDDNPVIIEQIRTGSMPVDEPGVEETITSAIADGALNLTSTCSDLSSCDWVLVTHDTPISNEDVPDAAMVVGAIEDLFRQISSNVNYVVRSQLPVGTCFALRELLKATDNESELIYVPENLQLGSSIDGLINPSTLIVGTESEKSAEEFLKWFPSPKQAVLVMDITSAELSKHAINAYLAMSIVFGNSIGEIAQKTNANAKHVVNALKSDPRVSDKAPLLPGLPFSGGTLGRDLVALTHADQNLGSAFFSSIHYHNKKRIDDLLDQILSMSKYKKEGLQFTVGQLGATYKPNTSTLRNSIPIQLAIKLAEHHIKMRVFDPGANFSEVELPDGIYICTAPEQVWQQADLLMCLTSWDQFRNIDWTQVLGEFRGEYVFDPTGVWEQRPPPAPLKYVSSRLEPMNE